ncbi:MAG: aspartate aminotransferase family protein [Planctomycetes bacterium]|nr:aspartate aminotransferase family protein [Planctomycetota bacterium]
MRPLVLERGQGARAWDTDGREYIDLMAAQGALNVGHCHPKVVAAVEEQLRRMTLCPPAVYSPQRAQLVERLCALAGMRRVFLSNSGTEANEAALKFARVSTGRTKVVAAKRGFHGRSMGSLSTTWDPKYRKPFEPLIPGVEHVTYDDLEALDAAVGDGTAAVILEVVQGEGGVHPASEACLRGAQALCRERGALLILDEVQTGFGRTGRLFAFQRYGLEPDLVSLAKSLGGGLPMGATLIGERVAALPSSSHGSTFGGNPLACAAALASLDAIEGEGLCERAERLGAEARATIAGWGLPVVKDVRGLGLMIGVELRKRVTPALKGLQERGVLALPAGNQVLRLLPPLVIEEDELAQALGQVHACLEAL